VTGGNVYNMMYTTALDLRNMLDVSRVVAASARMREETRGAHFRQDFPEQHDESGLFNIHLRRGADGKPVMEKQAVVFKYKSADECRRHGQKPIPAVAVEDE
jgi:succinate dehydrogenase/fumarate reductase flavoprotein subunit